MAGQTDLKKMLTGMQPQLMAHEYVFCSLPSIQLAELPELQPHASFNEAEGTSLLLLRQVADQKKLSYQGVFRQITLKVHSSLEAVGLTAAVSSCLADQGISANVIAAYYHDHILVPQADAHKALAALNDLASRAQELPPQGK